VDTLPAPQGSVARMRSILHRARDWRVVGTTAGMKVLVMGISGVVGIITSRLIIEHFGVDSYAQYGLLASLPALIPFADLGIGAAIVNTVAGSSDPRRDDAVHRVLTSALRVLLGSASVIAALSVVLLLTGMWPRLLGDGLLPDGEVVATICFVVFALTLPLGLGARVLVGLNRNPSQVAAQAVVAPFILVCVSTSIITGIHAGGFVALFSYLAATASALVCLALAARSIGPQLKRAVWAVPRWRAEPGVRIMNTAWPMLVLMLSEAFAMQTDRVLISNRADSATLAQYNLSFQLFGIVLQTVSAAGIALWPMYARARSRGEVRSPFKPALVFLVAGLVLGLMMAGLSPWLTALVSDGKIEVGGWILFGFTAWVGVQALKYPLGMYMTDAAGLRFQVVPSLMMMVVSIGLSWWLIGEVGAAGPAIGTAIAVGVCQIPAMVFYIVRDLRRRRLDEASPAAH
jgi:O-antigen/teichoic acid export membrane protein